MFDISEWSERGMADLWNILFSTAGTQFLYGTQLLQFVHSSLQSPFQSHWAYKTEYQTNTRLLPFGVNLFSCPFVGGIQVTSKPPRIGWGREGHLGKEGQVFPFPPSPFSIPNSLGANYQTPFMQIVNQSERKPKPASFLIVVFTQTK
jgi:hypothetical protein